MIFFMWKIKRYIQVKRIIINQIKNDEIKLFDMQYLNNQHINNYKWFFTVEKIYKKTVKIKLIKINHYTDSPYITIPIEIYEEYLLRNA